MANVRSSIFWAKLAILFSVVGVATILGSYLLPVSRDSQVLISLPGTAATFVGLYLFSKYWGRLDEAAQEAHKHAWLYGGLAGAFGLIFTASFLAGFQAGYKGVGYFDALSSFLNNPYVIGAGMMFGAQTIGYTVLWVWWWRSRR